VASLTILKQQGQFTDLELDFHKSEDPAGAASIKRMCIEYSKVPQSQLTIFIFDNDDQTITKDVSERGRDYKSWGNKVFSFVIPVPSHRIQTPGVCIEMYYRDGDITRQDAKNRHLFLSTEFHPQSGKHRTDRDLNCTDMNKIKDLKKLCIIDDRVFNNNSENVALPKDDFADYVLKQVKNFYDLDHMNSSRYSTLFIGSL
jgi:RNA-directed DNA polymerase